MNNTWFSSDHHFGHIKICELSNRPWDDVEAMNKALKEKWNQRVTPGDDVWVLGDFAMGLRTRIPEYLGQLNGNIALVAGNHDYAKSFEYFKTVHPESHVLRLDGKTCFLVHKPIEDGGWVPAGVDVILHGHLHGTYKESCVTLSDGRVLPLFDVGVDCRDYEPKTLSEILGKVT